MAPPQRQGERVATLGHGYQMDVGAHQAVAQHAHAAAAAALGQRFQIEPPVFVNQEDILTVVAPLGDVVRNAVRHHTGRPTARLPGPELANPADQVGVELVRQVRIVATDDVDLGQRLFQPPLDLLQAAVDRPGYCRLAKASQRGPVSSY